jgi:DNA-binding beta-propeller fold protein YncE
MPRASAIRTSALGRVLRLLPAIAMLLVLLPAMPGRPAADPLLSPRFVLGGQTRGVALSEPRGVAFDPADHAIYVSNTGAHRIEVFSRTGRPLGRFLHRVARPSGELVDGRPTALAFDTAGRLLVVDQLAAYVDVLDRRLRPVTRLTIPDGHPAAVAVGGDGTIWVGTTAEASRVYRFRRDYTPDGAWGEQGTAPGRLQDIAAIAVLGDTAIAVACERSDVTVQIFSPAGEYRRGFGTHEVGDGNFSLPAGLIVVDDGLWVLDEIRRTIQVFDDQGNFATRIEGSGTALGAFQHPSALAADGRGLIAVTDRGIGRVQVFAVATRREGGSATQPLQP